VPVVDEKGAVVGMVSQKDVLRASLCSIDQAICETERKLQLGRIELGEVMKAPLRTIDPGATVQDASRVLRDHKIGCLPVVEHGKLVGVISEHDLLPFVTEAGV
jgi:CBS domain-containing membrane protein